MAHKKRGHADRKSREFPLRDEEGQVYARVTKMLGNGRLMATSTDGCERLCTIRGSMRKREWVNVGDTVLLALREYADTRADVVYRYQDAEVQRLRKMGEDVAVHDVAESDDDGGGICFEHGDDDVDAI